MQFEELAFVCQQAALDLVSKHDRPVRPAVVLPETGRTRILQLPDFPEDDEARHEYLAELARTQLTEPGIPAWGFLAEAELSGQDVMVIVYGARRNPPHVSAAPFKPDGGLEPFLASEELDPTAMPFLHPLQHAVDALPGLETPTPIAPGQGPQGSGPVPGNGGLPIIGNP